MVILEDIKKHLAEKVGGRIFMTPTELEKYVIPISVRQQTKMRYEKRFPITHHKVGKTVLYSIDAIADYVVKGKQEPTSKVVSSDINKKAKSKIVKPKISQSSDDDFDLSHAFFLRNIFDNLQEELEEKKQLMHMFSKFIESQELHSKLQAELS